MWEAIDDLCALEGLTRDGLCDLVERTHKGQNRSSALRAFVVTYFHELSTRNGPDGAGHAALVGAGQQAAASGHLEHTIRTFRGA